LFFGETGRQLAGEFFSNAEEFQGPPPQL
jgi:hypothetical protein